MNDRSFACLWNVVSSCPFWSIEYYRLPITWTRLPQRRSFSITHILPSILVTLLRNDDPEIWPQYCPKCHWSKALNEYGFHWIAISHSISRLRNSGSSVIICKDLNHEVNQCSVQICRKSSWTCPGMCIFSFPGCWKSSLWKTYWNLIEKVQPRQLKLTKYVMFLEVLNVVAWLWGHDGSVSV